MSSQTTRDSDAGRVKKSAGRPSLGRTEPAALRGHLATILSALLISLAAGVLILAFEKELRSISRTGALGLAAALAALAAVTALAPLLSRAAHLAGRLPRIALLVVPDALLYLAPLLFVTAALIVVYAINFFDQDLLDFLAPFGPVLAGCGGAISLAAIAATSRIRARARVWRHIGVATALALAQVVAASVFSRLGFAIEAWGVGVFATTQGIADVQRWFGLIADMLDEVIQDTSPNRVPPRRKTRRGR